MHPVHELPLSMLVCAAMVLITTLVHYEGLKLSQKVARLSPNGSRREMLFVVIGCFTAHTVEVWIYAIAFIVLDTLEPGLSIAGNFEGKIVDYMYYSAVSYTSLGLGDIYPTGGLRLLTGVEALNGLLLIAWSASFTFLHVQRHWRF